MVSSGLPDDTFFDESEPRELRLEKLFADYVDRLNAGQILDRETIREAHPDLADELIDQLEQFEGMASGFRDQGSSVTLGDYTLQRKLGSGGMGVVYEAWENSMDRRVAVKVLPVGIAADAKTFTRFCREARLAGKLHHPNIVPIFGLTIKDDTPFYAMECVEGETLQQVLKRVRTAREKDHDTAGILADISVLLRGERQEPEGKQSSSSSGSRSSAVFARLHLRGGDAASTRYCLDIAEALAGVADGLHYAHSRGVIHRDIKPSNLIVDCALQRPDDALGTACCLRILDFGLARLEGQESLTHSGEMVGTPLYMSPEQAGARNARVDHRTDIYSLGATLYELLTWEPPFRGVDTHDILAQVVRHDAVPPRRRNPAVPKDLETITLKCLKKKPDDRYGTAEALAQDLRRFARGYPVEARAASRWERVATYALRHRSRLVVGLMIALLLVSLTWLFVKTRREERERRMTEYGPSVLKAVDQIRVGEFILQAVTDDSRGVSTRIFQLPLLTQRDLLLLGRAEVGGSIEDAVAALSTQARRVRERVEAPYWKARGLVLLGRGLESEQELKRILQEYPDFVPARALLQEPVPEDAEAGKASDRPPLQEVTGDGTSWRRNWLEAHRATLDGDWERAEAAYTALIAVSDSSREPLYIGSAVEFLQGRASARLEAGDITRAIQDLLRALARGDSRMETTLLLGKAYHLLGDKYGVEDFKLEAERLFKRLHDEVSTRDEAAVWITLVYRELRDDERGLEWARRIADPILGTRLQLVPLCLLNRYEEVVQVADGALDSGTEDPMTCILLAEALYLQSIYAANVDSRALLGRMARLLKRALDELPDHPVALHLLTQAHLGLRDIDGARETFAHLAEVCPENSLRFCTEASLSEARKDLRGALRLRMKAVRAEPDSVWHRLHLGNLLSEMYAYDAALKELSEAVRLEPRLLPSQSSLARSLLKSNKPEEACRVYEKVFKLRSELPIAHFLYAVALEKLGRLPEALRACAKSFRLWQRLGPRDLTLVRLLLTMDAYPSLALEATELTPLLEVLEGYGEGTKVNEPRRLGMFAALYLFTPGRKDLDLSLDCARRAVTLLAGKDADSLALLGKVLFERGATGEGIRLLERALGQHRALRHLERVLQRCRGKIWPLVVSCASINAGLEVGDLSEAVTFPDQPAGLALYLEGRRLQREGELEEAASRFERIREMGTKEVEPYLRLAECLRGVGKPTEAAARLAEALGAQGSLDYRLWQGWLSLCLVDLEMLPAEIRTELAERSPPVDVLWLLEALERLEEGEEIRINCGGKPSSPAGADRFYAGGGGHEFRLELTTEDADLYGRMRIFDPSDLHAGYHVPLPRAAYRVELHFIDSSVENLDSFDVLLEGRHVESETLRTPISIEVADVGTIERRVFELAVEDGSLDISFDYGSEGVNIAAVKIEKLGPGKAK